MNISNEEIFSENFRALKLVSECAYHAAEDVLLKTLDCFKESESPSIEEVMTLNNLGYIQHKLGNHKDSLTILTRAALFTPNFPSEIQYSIGTLVNLCSVNSALGFHQIALQQAFKALEISESSLQPEILAIIHYNIASQLALMERSDKAKHFFQETLTLSKNHFGSNHKLTTLAQKYSILCTTPGKYHYRVKSSGSASKNSSFSTNITNPRYTMQASDYTDKFAENKIKINFSTKIASISSTGRPIINKNSIIGMPYIKEIRKSKRIDASLFTTPKPTKKKTESVILNRNTALTANDKISKGFNLRKRLKAIKDHIMSLENRLKEFISLSRDLMGFFNFEEFEGSNDKMNAVFKIQRWFRKNLQRKNR
ncbi:hypothetical protein SteCoe_28819 [Stentor coeruleus]|uniref:Uncharacterized protein n=1 Tax=Stentor coeruleus TaxID=5963 RepID=A0A1R2B7P9_9CILI|nr:hypothetical protein SteCoe_28819 [Stentor coeruleus]